MIDGIYLSTAGGLVQEAKHSAIANNVANANTPGFKKERLVFETRLSPGDVGSAANPKGFWLAPGELARLLRPHFEILALSERATPTKWIAQAAAARR